MTPPSDNDWWEVEPKDRAEAVSTYVRDLRYYQEERHDRNLRHALMYDPVNGLDGEVRDASMDPDMLKQIVVENIIRQIVDTLTARIGKNRPRAVFQTDDAEWELQEEAKKAERAIEYDWDRTGFYDLWTVVFRDRGVLGDGAMLIDNVGGLVKPRRLLIDDITVDELECGTEAPMQTHWIEWISKSRLKKAYPALASEIEKTPGADGKWITMRTLRRDQVAVIHSWKLPSAPGADDGRWSVTTENVVLRDDPYTRSRLPIIFLKDEERVRGFYGCGVTERQATRQLRINRCNAIIIACQDRFEFPQINIHRADQNQVPKLLPRWGRVFFWSQFKPEIFTPQSISDSFYRYREMLKSDALKFEGVSEMSAHGERQPGLESGRAIQMIDDVQSDRFAIAYQRNERGIMDAAKVWIETMMEAATTSNTYKKLWRNRSSLREINWKLLGKNIDEMGVQLKPASLMSRTPAAKQDEIDWLLDRQMVNPQRAAELMNHPDLEYELRIANAPLRNADKVVASLLRTGDAPPPDPALQKLVLVNERVNAAILDAWDRPGFPQDRIEGMIQWLSESRKAEDKQKQAIMAQQQAAMPLPAAPPGPPADAPAPIPEAT